MDERELTTQPMKICNLFVETMEQLNYEDILIMWAASKPEDGGDVIHTGSKGNTNEWEQLYFETTTDFISLYKTHDPEATRYTEKDD